MKKILIKMKSIVLDVLSIVALLKERLIRRNGSKIRVGFVCQYIPAWNKSFPIYEELKNDSRFEVVLICVPNRIENYKLKEPENMYNDTYEYFVEHGYQAINALVGEDEWLDLKELNLDYIFYTRPYDEFMPKEYRSRNVCRYSKICLVLYAMTMTRDTLYLVLNRGFMRNVYCYFSETTFSMKKNIKQLWFTHRLGLQKTVYYGMPALEQIVKNRGCNSDIWKFSKNTFRVMWTPRWTTNLNIGGSNFFKYKDLLLEYAKQHGEIDFLFRPHPLAFQNFIKTGEMTEREVQNYKEQIRIMPNIHLDETEEYVSTMWNSDVLVSDVSGILPEYFVMEKPIIFCATNMVLHLTEHFEKMLKGCYIANNEKDLFYWINELKNGNDPLREQRQKIICEIFGDTLQRSSSMIVEELYNGVIVSNDL